MSIIRNKQKIYNSNSPKMTPVWKLDTTECMVIYFDECTLTEKRTYYYTDYIIAHLRYVSSKNPDRLRKLVDNGKIIEYLDDIETQAMNEFANYVAGTEDYETYHGQSCEKDAREYAYNATLNYIDKVYSYSVGYT